ncbi:hypothetical protein V1517DRAFT_316732 [Lipomyces orientalis]|uniref:Uncharacterized protein n=1 Tax=Lipomyces orientalis TaxID=1233043 RepID=A0ACC3TVC8_9ASCO
MTPDFVGRLFATAWKSDLPPDKPLQLIASQDIGYFAAQALVDPESWRNRVLSIAGDELTFSEANEIFKSLTGNPAGISTTNWIFVWAIGILVKELRTMFKFFAKEGFGADIEELRKMHPQLQDFKTWLKMSTFVK